MYVEQNNNPEQQDLVSMWSDALVENPVIQGRTVQEMRDYFGDPVIAALIGGAVDGIQASQIARDRISVSGQLGYHQYRGGDQTVLMAMNQAMLWASFDTDGIRGVS